MARRNSSANHPALESWKLKTCPSSSGEAYIHWCSGTTHASATAKRAGSYSLKTWRHSR